MVSTASVSVGSWKRWVASSTAVVLPSVVSAPAKSALEVRLEYTAPAGIGCPSEAEFRAAIVERLDLDPFVQDATRTVEVEIAPASGRLNGQVRWVDRDGVLEGQRHFDAGPTDCSGLARNMAFAITVQLQLLGRPTDDAPPSAAEMEASGEPTETPRPSPDAAATQAAPTPASTPASDFELGAGVGPFVVSGWTPDVAFGGRLTFVGRGPRFLVQLAFEASLPQRHDTDEAGAGFETSVLAASAAPCYRWPVVEACPVLRVGQVRARGFGVDQPQSPRGTLWEIGFRLGAGRPLMESLEGKAYLELAYTLSPWTVRLDERSVFTPPSFVVLGGIDLMAFFL